MAYENGEVENRIIEDNGKYNESFLTKASNYLTSKFTNKNITQIKKVIQLDIKKSQDDLETISSKLIQKGIMLPSLSLSGTGARTSNFDTNQDTDSYSISLNSSYTLFDFGSLKAKKRAFIRLNEASKLSFKKYEDDLILSVAKVHLELFKAIKIVKLYENSLEIRKQQFLAVKNRFDLGEATRSDLLRSKASISGAESQLKVGQANVKKFRESYKTLVGKGSDKPLLPEMKIKEPSTLEMGVRGGIENDIALKILTFEERALRSELSSIEKSQLPI